ncbi:MAG: hypothetical protein HYR62_01880 [Actinobacteria bacterium]|nr:hypothetical protein [Actinomycetota bacterium]MBI3687232.1 hypothetical protein [Actinomycetota bacterium]
MGKKIEFGIFATDHGAARTITGVGKAFDRSAKDAERASGRIGRAGSAIGRTGGKLASFGKGAGAVGVGVLGAVVGVGMLGSTMLRTAANMELMDRKAKIVFGKGFPAMESWAKKVGSRMGLTSREVLRMASGMQDLLVPMGFTRDRAQAMTRQLAGLSGALSEWSGGTRSASEVGDILSAALLGERDALQGLGIGISQAQVDAQVLANAKKGLVFATDEQAQAQATLDLIMAKSTDAQNAYSSSQGTLAAKLAASKSKLGELRDALIVKVTPWLTTAFTWFETHWPDLALGLLSVARAATIIISPMFSVAAAGLRVGSALLKAAAAAAFATGNITLGNSLWKKADGMNKLAGDAERMGRSIHDNAIAALDEMERKLRAIKSKTVTITVQQRMAGYYIDTSGQRRKGLAMAQASGTSWFRGGWSWVGERGAELLRLPAGTQILDAESSARRVRSGAVPAMAGAGGGWPGVTINMLNRADPREIMRELAWVLKTSGR